jgi:ATP-binding cassette, subfamily B, bacterial MsbA
MRRFLELLRSYLAPHWGAVALLLVTSYLATVLAALFPILMAPILDLALGGPTGARTGDHGGLSLANLGAAFFRWIGVHEVGDRLRAVALLCVAYFTVGILKGSLDFGNFLLALWIRARAVASMQMDLFRHLLSLSMRFFTQHHTGELVSHLETDTRAASSGLETIVCTALTAPVLIAFYGYLMVRTSPKLVVAALGAAAMHVGVTRLIRRPIRRLANDQFSAFAELAARFQEAILSIRVIKSLGAEAFELARVGRTMREVLRVNVKFGVYKHAEEPARAVVNYAVEAGILLLATYELLAGRLATPTFFLFLYVARASMTQIGLLASAYTQMQATLAAATRIGELFALQPKVQDGPARIETFQDRIVLRDVAFRYDTEPVLDGVNLEIRKGEVVALVGPSGFGKSTLADLVLRFYDPTRGTITIDGRDLRSLRQDSYRRLFGVVPQEPLLFNAAIRDNIAYGREDLSSDDIVLAARLANAHDFIVEFADGYDTVVGDRGVRLSGGQRQRVAIARAIVARPPILVLDEATSSLDSESERLVQQAIDRVIEGSTSLVIAHRLSTVLHADKIVVMGRGGVEAIGRHAALLATSETYSRLYRLQFAEEHSIGRL